MNRLRITIILGALLTGPLHFAAADGAGPVRVSLEDAYRIVADGLGADAGWKLVLPDDELAGDREGMIEAVREAAAGGSDLAPGRLAGVLVALADRTALDGDPGGARVLYGLLAASGSPLLEGRAIYMTAGLDFAEASYGAAASGYALICGGDHPASWRDHACAMADLARRLDELLPEGGRHGDAAAPTP